MVFWVTMGRFRVVGLEHYRLIPGFNLERLDIIRYYDRDWREDLCNDRQRSSLLLVAAPPIEACGLLKSS